MIVFAIMLLIVFAAMIIVGNLIAKSGKRAKEAAGSDSWDRKNAEKTIKLGKRLKTFSAIPVVILLIATLLSGIHIVDTTEVGVVKTFGQIQRTVDGGLNLVNPFTDTVEMYDLRVHVKEAQFASYTKDAQPLTATIESQFALQPEYAMEVAKIYGSQEIMESKLANIIEERAKIVFSRYSAMTLLENRSKLSAEVEQEMKNIEDLFHVDFTSVVVRDVDFSDAFEASVEAKMEAEQKALKAEQEKKEAIIRAEQAEETAKIEARAKVAEAQGEAEALMITKEALEKMPSNYTELQYLEKWNGVLPQIVSEGSNLMLTPNLGK